MEDNNSQQFEGKIKQFYDFHGVQLYGVDFPMRLVPQLVEKLETEKYDFMQSFDVQDNQEEETFQSSAQREMKKESAVFVIEHQFTFKMEQLRKILESNKQLTENLRYQLQYQGEKKVMKDQQDPQKTLPNKNMVELDGKGIIDPRGEEIPSEAESLSLFDNNIESLEYVSEVLKKLPQLKVLFLNYNPVSEIEGFKETIERDFPTIELLNSKFTKNANEFSFKFAHYKYNLEKTNKMRTDMMKQLDLQKRGVFQLSNFSVFENFKNLIQLDLRRNSEGDQKQLAPLLEVLAHCKKLRNINLDEDLENALWDLYEAGKLKEMHPLLISVNDRHFSYGRPLLFEEDIRFVQKNIWKQAGNYRLVSETQMDETSYWYLNDLCGISVQHSDTPNVRMTPFLYAPNFKLEDAKPYTLMWITNDLNQNDILYRDYLVGFNETSHRTARLTVWFQGKEEFFAKACQEHKSRLLQTTLYGKKFLATFKSAQAKFVGLNETLREKRPLNVITDNSLVTEFLTAKELQICQTLEEADVIFLTHCFEETIRDHYLTKFCNQFPDECHIVQKHHLADTVNSILGQVDWLQPTYNLKTQMNEFVGEYQRRNTTLEDNVWIIKAFNLARSIDMIVTDNLDQIIRQTETLPRLAQKYISNPVTIFNKKIDLRYIIAVRSLEPLDIFLYKVFWIRTSNNDFSNDYRSRDEYETHFTVMNYGKKLKQIHFDEFITQFELENPDVKWDSINLKIQQMVRELFMAVTKKYPGMPHPNCRGVYGMDVMIESGTFQPKLLELTFSPDCERACKYHPSFYNDMFQLLFLNDQKHPNYEALF